MVASPNPDLGPGNFLTGATCVSASDCWAVGHYYDGSPLKALTEHYNGSLWTVVSSPDPPSSTATSMVSVKCVTSIKCWAVGYYTSTGGTQTLIEQYNGTGWVVVPTSPSTTASVLYNVASP